MSPYAFCLALGAVGLGAMAAEALAEAKLVTIASDGRGAPDATANNIVGVIQTVLAAQLVGRSGVLENAAVPPAPASAPVPPAAKDGGKR